MSRLREWFDREEIFLREIVNECEARLGRIKDDLNAVYSQHAEAKEDLEKLMKLKEASDKLEETHDTAR